MSEDIDDKLCYSDQEEYDEEYGMEEYSSVKGNTSLEKLTGRILNVHEDYRTTLSDPKIGKDRNKYTDRANRAVSEQVLDDRIVRILLKLIHNDHLYQVNGCLATGKEANVYHAVTADGQQRAIKIYKSTILTFKNRDRYVTGEYRFRTGYCRSNPRKLTAMWAEKEMRNLKRLQTGGLRCPAVHLVKQQVLLMDFIPEDTGSHWPAPRLKDWTGTPEATQSLFYQCIQMMRTLHHECHLVHADLSEYNLLVGDGGTHLYMIDVSQSVEHEHPRALDFLRTDCRNIINFFRQRDVYVPTVRGLFEFVTARELNVPITDYILQIADLYPFEVNEQSDACNDQVQKEAAYFDHMILPQNIQQARQDDQMELYAKMTGVTLKENIVDTELVSEETDSENGSEAELIECLHNATLKEPISKDELKVQRKIHKQEVKQANKERRQTTKMPKHLKKKATKRKHK